MDWTHRLRLRHLQVLLSLAGTGNLSQSAVVLATTQPALSKWLKELEEDVGLPLFERHARPAADTVWRSTDRACAPRRSAARHRDDMAALREGGSGLVTIGTSGVAAADTVPLAVSQLLKRMPRAQVRMTESTMNQLMPQLARSELDIVVGRSGSTSVDPLLPEALYVDPVVFVARPGHALAGATSVGWDDVLAYSWIVWPSGTPVHNALEAALSAAGRVRPPHCVESNSSILNLTLLNNTDLLGVASHRAAQRFAQLNAIRILPMQLEGAVSMLAPRQRESRGRGRDDRVSARLCGAAGRRMGESEGGMNGAARCQPGRVAVLPCCRVAVLPCCRVAVLPCCRVAVLPCCRVAVLPCCRVAVLPWCRGAVVPWCRGAVVPWCRGAVVPWCRGAVVPWCRGAVVPWCRDASRAVAGCRAVQHQRADPRGHERRTRHRRRPAEQRLRSRATRAPDTRPSRNVTAVSRPSSPALARRRRNARPRNGTATCRPARAGGSVRGSRNARVRHRQTPASAPVA